MASRFHAARQRRAERSGLSPEGINLTPLVDMFVSILFFVLLSYTGATAFLFNYTLELPPVIRNEGETAGPTDVEIEQLMTVRIENDRLVIDRASSSASGFHQEIAGLDSNSFRQLETVLAEQRSSYPQQSQVLVIPSDATAYDHIIAVLEKLQVAKYPLIALGQRSRSPQVASASNGRQ